MGAGESKQKLGERVIAARNKLEQDLQMVNERGQSLRNASPATMKLILDRMQASFETFSPFLERTLLVAWNADNEKCKDFILKACRKVLTAPINASEYEWFKQYVLPSTVWLFETSKKRFLYEELMAIVQRQSADIVNNMDSVYAHLEKHSKWSEVMAIENQSLVGRQDDGKVGLLKDAGIQKVADEKDEEIRSFVDSHVAIQTLTVTAKAIDTEFQMYVKNVMSQYGQVQAGPTKKVERCLSKLENDYQDAAYPKSAKLLDLVRCSVTCNTLEQLLIAYQELMRHMDRSSSNIKMARVKNGFLDKQYDGGYRDIKVNVVFQSPINPKMKMICEVQLILSQYLNEKKKIHKLYSIAREETYFQMIVQEDGNSGPQKELKDLQFNPRFNLIQDMAEQLTARYKSKYMFKCSVDSATELLSVEGKEWFGVVDMKQRKLILDLSKKDYGEQASHWLKIQKQKYLSVQLSAKEISMYKLSTGNEGYKLERDDNYKIIHTGSGSINYVDFDSHHKHFVLLVDLNTLQLRSLSDVNSIKKVIPLDEKVKFMRNRCMQLSANGARCVLSGGHDNPYFYVINVENGQKQKFTSKFLKDAKAPCFINGEAKYVFVSDREGRMEIWDIDAKQPIKSMEIDTKKNICSSASTNNLLAIGSEDKCLRLYDVRNWQWLTTKQLNVDGDSLHLTDDLKYVTFSGFGGDRCVVLKVE